MQRLRELSLRLETETGFDSIQTIEEKYDHAEHLKTKPYECPFPECNVHRKSAIDMWVHVHFQKHGLSFGKTYAEMMKEAKI